MRLVVVGLVALIVGVVLGGGYGMMQVDEVTQKLTAATSERDQAVQSADRLRKLNDDAPKKYGRELGKLVMAVGAPAPSAKPAAAAPAPGQPAPAPAPAAPAADDPAKLVDSARAILAARDGYRSSLDGVRASMDSEFDAIAAELGNATPDAGKVKQLLDALKQNWPNKEKDMEAATRKVLVELGLISAPPAPKPAAAAPAPAAAAPAAAPAPAEKK